MTFDRVIHLGVTLAAIALSGCNNADEANAKGACEKASPGNKAKIEECLTQSKQAVDKNLGGITKALKVP